MKFVEVFGILLMATVCFIKGCNLVLKILDDAGDRYDEWDEQ